MEIPIKYLISDIRTPKEFNQGTISGYKKRDVIKAFENAIINSKLEEAIHWCVELHISTYDKEIWKSIFEIYFKYIHVNNPKLFFYIIQIKEEYEKIIIYYPKHYYLFSRNNQQIRNLFCNLVCISCLSKKNNLFLDKSLPKVNLNKITKDELKNRIIQDNYQIIKDLNYDDLNQTEILCLNQIFTNLSNHNGTLKNCLYWYILLEKSIKQRNNNKKVDIKDNLYKNYDVSKNSMLNYIDKHKIIDRQHWTNLIWEMFFKILTPNHKNTLLINKLKNYYNQEFKDSKISSLKYCFFIIFYIYKSNLNWNNSLIPKYSYYIQCCAAINTMYFNIYNNVLNVLDQNTKELLIKKFYNLKEMIINKHLKEPKKIIKNKKKINLNKIIKGNPLNSNLIEDENDEYIEEDKVLINKNKTKKDIIDAKEEKVNKKLDFFNQIISKKSNEIKKYSSQPSNEIKELFIIKKRKS